VKQNFNRFIFDRIMVMSPWHTFLALHVKNIHIPVSAITAIWTCTIPATVLSSDIFPVHVHHTKTSTVVDWPRDMLC